MCAELLKSIVESSRKPLTVALSDAQATVLVLRLPPGGSLPERRHVRSDVVIQVLEGRAEIKGFAAHSLATPEVLFIPRGEGYSVRCSSEDPLVLLTVITPGVTMLESRPFGSVKCPMCSAEIAVEEGDLAGDRFICPDCTVSMRIVEADRGHVAEPDTRE